MIITCVYFPRPAGSTGGTWGGGCSWPNMAVKGDTGPNPLNKSSGFKCRDNSFECVLQRALVRCFVFSSDLFLHESLSLKIFPHVASCVSARVLFTRPLIPLPPRTPGLLSSLLSCEAAECPLTQQVWGYWAEPVVWRANYAFSQL